jgi:hypothetical protein
MHILFISEPYVERTLLNYFSKICEHTVILLQANHPELRLDTVRNVQIMNLHDALMLCDSIYILGSEKVSAALVEKCLSAAEQRGIQHCCIEKFDGTAKLATYLDGVLATYSKNVPVVLVLQAGKRAQVERTELHLCGSLNINGVKFAFHSNTGASKMNDFARALCANDMFRTEEEAQISIVTIKEDLISLMDNAKENMVFDSFIRSIQPDFVIVCCENDFNLHNKMNEMFMAKYSREIDTFVVSEYVSLGSNKHSEVALFINGNEIIDLFGQIVDKLTFPNGVTALKPL